MYLYSLKSEFLPSNCQTQYLREYNHPWFFKDFEKSNNSKVTKPVY
ncbi:hypothetical protein ACXYVC_01205 [Mesomycoplasma ovipneumoniae]